MNKAKLFLLLFLGIAVGFLLWLMFFSDLHTFNRQVKQDAIADSQQARANQAVGAAPLPKAPVQIVIRNVRYSCRIIDRVELDEKTLYVYWHKVCSDNYDIASDHIAWKGYAPDGTVITSGAEEAAEIAPGEKSEFHTDDFVSDPRIVKVVIEANWNDEWQ